MQSHKENNLINLKWVRYFAFIFIRINNDNGKPNMASVHLLVFWTPEFPLNYL